MKFDFSNSEISEREFQDAEYLIKWLFRTYCGTINSAVWMVCLEAYEQVRRTPMFHKRLKDGNTPKWHFKRVFKEFNAYERTLIYGEAFDGFYDLAKMPPEYRKCFGNISNREYYELWFAVGTNVYEKTYPFVSCLVNKFKLSFLSKYKDNATVAAWLWATIVCFRISHTIFQLITKTLAQKSGIAESRMNKMFSSFSLSRISQAWADAGGAFMPNFSCNLNEISSSNVVYGVEDLITKWSSKDTIFASIHKAFNDYDEVWRTPGEQKRAEAIIEKLKDEISDFNFYIETSNEDTSEH